MRGALDFHADDFALTAHSDGDIISLLESGALDSISAMPNMSGFPRTKTLLGNRGIRLRGDAPGHAEERAARPLAVRAALLPDYGQDERCSRGGVQLSSVGVCGLYIAKIYTEVKRRPMYIVKEEK